MLLALIWKFDFPPFMVLIIAILNDGMCFFSVLSHVKIGIKTPIVLDIEGWDLLVSYRGISFEMGLS